MPSASKWRTRIDDWKQLYAKKDADFKRITDYYSNKFQADLLTVNIVFSFGRSMVPQLYFKNPVVAVNIERPGFEQASLTLQKVDDAIIRAMRMKQTLKKMITNAFCYGRGVGKCGFSHETLDSALVDRMTGAVPTTDIPIYKLRQAIGPNRPWFQHFYPDDFAFDSQVSDFEDSAWNAMRFERSVEQVRDDKSMKWFAKKGLDNQDEDDIIGFWEVWDKHTGKFFVLADDQDQMSSEQDFSVWPFYTLDFNWTPRNPVPTSDAQLILKLQDEYNEIKTQIHEHRRISVVKFLARKNALDREAKKQLDSGKVGPVVEIDGPPGETVTEFKPSIPMELFTTSNTTMDDVRDVIGFTRNQLGEFQSPRRTAREAQIVQSAITLRLDERRDMVGDLIGDVLQAANDYIIGAWDAPEAEKYAGSSEGWEKLPEIQGEYTINVVPDSTLPAGRQVQQAEAKELYMTLRGDPMIDQVKLRLRYLTAFETGDVSLLNPQLAMQAGAPGGQPLPGMPASPAMAFQGGGPGPGPTGPAAPEAPTG